MNHQKNVGRPATGQNCPVNAVPELDKLASEELFKKAFNANPYLMALSTLEDGIFIYVNEGFTRILGYRNEEAIGKKSTELSIWTDAQRMEIIQMLQNQTMVHNVDVLLRKKSGEFLFGLMSAESFEYKGKQCLIISITDITKLKETIHALRLSEERFAKMFNASPLPMAIRAVDTRQFIDVNDSFLRQYGITREIITGMTVGRNTWKDPAQFDRVEQLLITQGYVRNEEVEYYDYNNNVYIGLYSAEIIELNGIPCVLSAMNDVTQKRQLEKELARLSQMHLVGQMAANIGHEIRNPMTTVRGYLQLLGNKPELIPFRQQFSTMIEELDRANSIISEFLSLAKDKLTEMQPQNMNNIIQSLAPLLDANAITTNKNVLLDLGDIPELLIDEKEIRQLLLNLVSNGLEAMQSGGTLTIKTYLQSSNVVLAVIDEGAGIPPHVLDKLGTPFLTTKEYGTGLGLAVCFSIAARHNATIHVDSSQSGTTFSVKFRPINMKHRDQGAEIRDRGGRDQE
jgi:PAS domain S-box-containing protein